MHNSQGGKPMSGSNAPYSAPGLSYKGTGEYAANNYLLQGSDQSSTCLNCHGISKTAAPNGYQFTSTNVTSSADIPGQRTPGGDFGWLNITTSAIASDGVTNITNPGQRHGHDIIAADYGFNQSTTFTAAPGGTYSVANLHCSSCHDPHGKYRYNYSAGTVVNLLGTGGAPIAGSGSYGDPVPSGAALGVYRLLAGLNYAPQSYVGAPAFVNNSPIAVAPKTYNATEASSSVVVGYGQNMSEWCGNCHGQIVNQSSPMSNENGGFTHPAGNNAKLTQTLATNYNTYVTSGTMNTSLTANYTSLVPYENGTADVSKLTATLVSSTGASTSSNVMCLSCHRAHATAWPNMTRWNNQSQFLTMAGAYPTSPYGEDDLGYSQAQIQAAYYDRPAGTGIFQAAYQRSLCNKCHAQD
jgi:hypothetical protein